MKKITFKVLLIFVIPFGISCETQKESIVLSEVESLNVEYFSSFSEKNEIIIGNPGNLAVDKKGAIFLVDLLQNQILIFDADLILTEVINRTGKGPGEFINISDIQIHNNTLYVFDTGNYSVSLLDLTSGEYPLISKHQFKIKEMRVPYSLYPFGEYHMLVRGMASTGIEKKFKIFFDLFSNDFTLIQENYITINDPSSLTFKRDNNVYLMSIPFSAEPVTAIDQEASTFIYGRGDSLKLTGTTVNTTNVLFEINLPERKITEEEITNELNQYDDLSDEIKEHIPENKPSFYTIFFGEEYYWVNQGYSSDMNRWLVINRDGEIKRQFYLDKNIDLQAVRDNRLYGVKEGESIIPKIIALTFDPF